MNDLSRETGALLDEGRDGESLSPVDKARLKRAVLAQVAAASVVSTTSTAAAWTSTAKAVGAILIVTTAGGTAAVVASQTKAAKAPRVTLTVSAPRSVPAPVPAPVAAPVPVPAASPVPVPEVSPPVRSAPVASPAPAVALSPVSPSRSFPAPAPGPAPASPPSSLEVETSLLKEADEALKRGDPNRSLDLLAQLATRFPNSALAPERSAARVFALCMAGRKDDARQEAGVFLSVQPTGPLALRVRGSCGGERQ